MSKIILPEEKILILKKKIILPKEITLAPEIECLGIKAQSFLKDNPTVFAVDKDITLDDNLGIEFKPKKYLTYTYEDLNILKKTLDIINANGFYVDSTCGGHIHIGFDYLGSLGALLTLLSIYKYFEREIYTISNEKGNRIRNGCERFAASIDSLMNSIELELKIRGTSITPEKLVAAIDEKHKKSDGLNIKNIGNSNKNTTEFRISNSTLSYNVLDENMELFGSLVMRSKDIFENYYYQLEINRIISEKRSCGDKINILLNLLFDKDSNRKDIYYERYYANRDDPMLNNLGMTNTTLKNYPTIKKVLEKKR